MAMTTQDELIWLAEREAELSALLALIDAKFKSILANPPDCPPVNPPVHEQYPLGDGDLVAEVDWAVDAQRVHDCLFAGGGVWAKIGRPSDLSWADVRIVESSTGRTIIKPMWGFGNEGPREELADPADLVRQLYIVHRWGA
jgi:hypothetical protein